MQESYSCKRMGVVVANVPLVPGPGTEGITAINIRGSSMEISFLTVRIIGSRVIFTLNRLRLVRRSGSVV